MTDAGGHSVSELSLSNRDAFPSGRRESSRDVGWKSLLLDLHWFEESSDAYESAATPDQTIGLATSGHYDFSMHRGGGWRHMTKRPGSVGMGCGGLAARCRVTVPPRCVAGAAMLYLPRGEMIEAAEHFRRIGQSVGDPTLDMVIEKDPGVAQMVGNLTGAMRGGLDDLYAQAAASWLAVHLVSVFGVGRGVEDLRSPGVITDARLARVIEMMSSRLDQPLTLDELADEACISKYHFVRLFGRKVGRTPYAFLTQLRMDAARRMLASSDQPVSQVARACGFPDPENFTAMFTARFGLPPKAFRARERGFE